MSSQEIYRVSPESKTIEKIEITDEIVRQLLTMSTFGVDSCDTIFYDDDSTGKAWTMYTFDDFVEQAHPLNFRGDIFIAGNYVIEVEARKMTVLNMPEIGTKYLSIPFD